MKSYFTNLERLRATVFYEEYDSIDDSVADSNDQKFGKNPMSLEQQQKVNAKRIAFGVSPLNKSGLPIDNSAMELCLIAAADFKAGKRTDLILQMKQFIREIVAEEKGPNSYVRPSSAKIPTVKHYEPTTWTETMIVNTYKLYNGVNTLARLESLNFTEYREKLFTDAQFAKERCPTGDMDQEDCFVDRYMRMQV